MLRQIGIHGMYRIGLLRAFSTAQKGLQAGRVAPGPTHSFEHYNELTKRLKELTADPVKEKLKCHTKRQFESFENRINKVVKRASNGGVPSSDSMIGLNGTALKYTPETVPNRKGIEELFDLKLYDNKPIHLRMETSTSTLYRDQEEKGIVRNSLASDPATFRKFPSARSLMKGTGKRGAT